MEQARAPSCPRHLFCNRYRLTSTTPEQPFCHLHCCGAQRSRLCLLHKGPSAYAGDTVSHALQALACPSSPLLLPPLPHLPPQRSPHRNCSASTPARPMPWSSLQAVKCSAVMAACCCTAARRAWSMVRPACSGSCPPANAGAPPACCGCRSAARVARPACSAAWRPCPRRQRLLPRHGSACGHCCALWAGGARRQAEARPWPSRPVAYVTAGAIGAALQWHCRFLGAATFSGRGETPHRRYTASAVSPRAPGRPRLSGSADLVRCQSRRSQSG